MVSSVVPLTLVVKIGTSSLTQGKTGSLALGTLGSLIEVLTQWQQQGHRVVLVSSGAVGVGCARLRLGDRPRKLAQKQAIAAVGQGRLMRLYDDLFSNLQQPIAQVLLTRNDLVQRESYLNIRATFRELFALGVIPIVNENDTVAVDELKFGDNDSLSALVASLVEADWLFILTDVDRLYSADPRTDPHAQPIAVVTSEELQNLSVKADSTGSQWGTGGMATKLTAARIATSAGVRTVITQGQQPTHLPKILGGADIGTRFEPQPRPENARKRWIAHGLLPQGDLILDGGAVRALCDRGRSLLPAGIAQISGQFVEAAAVRILDPQGREIGRGLVNYNSEEIDLIRGQNSQKIPEILGYDGPETVIHRDNLVIL